MQEATRDIADFFSPYVRDSHPCKDLDGRRLRAPWLEAARDEAELLPHHVNLLEMLEEALGTETDAREPDLSRLRRLLAALIEDGQMHTSHGHHEPRFGVDPCARKKRGPAGEQIYCRYLFPRPLVLPTPERPGMIFNGPHRPGLRNLALPRNDTLVNSFEERLLLSSLGNIDWRPLINLWSVLEYLTKYTAKAGEPTRHVGALFEDVVHRVVSFEEEDGTHDLWRRAIMKFYNQMLGNRDYTLLEVLHFGLRLPGVASALGRVRDVSVSQWSALRRGGDFARLSPGDRCTLRNKLELFGARGMLTRPSTVHLDDLRNISFYQFWRLYSVERNRIVRHQRERIVAVNGLGWPAQARRTHAQHDDYARKTLYAYAPCHDLRGIDYIDDYVVEFFAGSWSEDLRQFVMDDLNAWCPVWVRRNYEVLNPTDLEPAGDDPPETRAEARRRETVFVFEETASQPPPAEPERSPTPEAAPTTAPSAAQVLTGVFQSGEPPVEENDAERPEAYAADHHWAARNREPWQLHSEQGPNVGCEGRQGNVVAETDALVNPLDHTYKSAIWTEDDLEAWRQAWNRLQSLDEATLTEPEARDWRDLQDSHQQLFAQIALRHVDELLASGRASAGSPRPLRLLLLGTPGTGKTTTLRATLSAARA